MDVQPDVAVADDRGSAVVRFRDSIRWLLSPATTAPPSTFLIRLMVGAVFLSEGTLKFVYTNQGVGRFTKLGFPFSGAVATAVAAFEIVGGLLLIGGLFTRVIALVFSLEMVVATLTTKITLFFGVSPLAPPPSPPTSGIWAVLHEGRSEWAQLMGCIFLVIVGAGVRSLDARRQPRVFVGSTARSPLHASSLA
jgi:putative oxidoreductase